MGGTGFFSQRLGSVAGNTRQKMVSKDHDLSVRRQCSLLLLTRSNLYYQPKGESAENLRFMVIIHCLAGHVYMPEKGQAVSGNALVWVTATSRALLCNTLPVSEWRGICNARATNADGTGHAA